MLLKVADIQKILSCSNKTAWLRVKKVEENHPGSVAMVTGSLVLNVTKLVLSAGYPVPAQMIDDFDDHECPQCIQANKNMVSAMSFLSERIAVLEDTLGIMKVDDF